MVESNQKHMKPSWATGQTASIRGESIIHNGSFLGGQFSCTHTPPMPPTTHPPTSPTPPPLSPSICGQFSLLSVVLVITQARLYHGIMLQHLAGLFGGLCFLVFIFFSGGEQGGRGGLLACKVYSIGGGEEVLVELGGKVLLNY